MTDLITQTANMLSNAVLLAADRALADHAIIANVLNGKKEDYEILVRRYNSMLYKTARGILVEEEDIEDVMQEAYIRGFEKLAQFRREAQFSTWLTRILINCALKHLHALQGRTHVDIDTLPCKDIDQLQEVQDERPSDSDVGNNLRKAIEGAIGQLPPKYRVVFILREVEKIAVSDVAARLDITEENVKIRLHRAKSMLKEVLRMELSSLEIFEFQASRCSLMAMNVMQKIYSGQVNFQTLEKSG